MPTPTPSSPAPARPSRLLAFLDAHRRVLVLVAIIASGLLTSVPSLPAAADALFGTQQPAVPLQSYTAPASALTAPAARDAFTISSYSVVQWPVPADTAISSGFGLRDCEGCATDHKGTDFTPGNGSPIQAIADGVVTYAGWDSGGYGYLVIVQHVINGQNVQSFYAHMQEGSIGVTVGQQITRGQQVGSVGNTGQSTGPHLHLGILIDDAFVDPYPWMLANVNV